MDLSNYKDHFILFVEMGFVACNQSDEDSAIKLFKAAELLNPENIFPQIGMGYLKLHQLHLTQCKEILEECLIKEPENEIATTLLGICLSLTPDKVAEGEKLLNSMRKSTHDSQVKNVAVTALEFVDTFVKKAPSPVEVQKRLNS